MRAFFLRLLCGLLSIFLGFVLFATYFALGTLSSITILFYRGIALAVLAVLTQATILLAVRRCSYGVRTMTASSDILPSAALAFALNIVFLVVFPVTIDRSVTVFLLGYMNKSGKQYYSYEDLNSALIDIYVKDYGAAQRRMQEQILSGNIKTASAGFALTDQGKQFLRVSKLMAKVFPIDTKFIDSSEILASKDDSK